MLRGKLILICQSGGDFKTNDDGSLRYVGGEAQAVDIIPETVFDALKLKFAEICNLELESLSIKYFVPGNNRTLITLANDRDLKRMYDIHKKSVTADVFVTGKEGFNHEALDRHPARDSGIKLAETVTGDSSRPTATPVAAKRRRASIYDVPVRMSEDLETAIKTTAKSTKKRPKTSRKSAARAVTRETTAASRTDDPVSVTPQSLADDPSLIDMFASPADTVKKRRRTASWKTSATGPTIVSATDNAVVRIRSTPLKKNMRNGDTAGSDSVAEHEQGTDTETDDPNFILDNYNANDLSPEKLVTSWKFLIKGVGQNFGSVKEFRDALQKYAIAHRFMYKFKKNNNHRASAICMAEGCCWRIHASWVPSDEVFRIKKMNEEHTCEGESRKSAHPSKNWLVSVIKDTLQDNPHCKPKEISRRISQDFGLQLNYTQVRRGIEDARVQLQGSYKEAYNLLPWFCENLIVSNPGSFAKVFTRDDNRFQRLFVSLNASIQGFCNGCRPLLYLTSTPFKSRYHEVLLTASGLDGNDDIFPVAFAVVDIETDDNWHWFLEQLRAAVTTSRAITFVFDMEKGLKKSVLEVFENAHIGYSTYQLLRSFKENLKGPFHGDGKVALPGNFMAAAFAVRLDSFRWYIEQIKRASLGAYDWIMQVEPEHWTNAACKGEYFNQINVNVAQFYAGWVDEVRELPIIRKLDAVVMKMMELLSTRHAASIKCTTNLTPLKEAKLQEETMKAQSIRVLFSTDTLFEVHDDSIHVLDMGKCECSCMGWKISGLPCRHAIAVFNCTGRNTYEYCSKYFTADSFRLAYFGSVHPISASAMPLNEEAGCSETISVLPPLTSRPPGEQSMKRTKADRELKREMSCSICKGFGHNKATCKEAPLDRNKVTCEEAPLGDSEAPCEEAPLPNNAAICEEVPLALGDNGATCGEVHLGDSGATCLDVPPGDSGATCPDALLGDSGATCLDALLGDSGATCPDAPLCDSGATCPNAPLGDNGAACEEAPMGDKDDSGATRELAPLGDSGAACEEAPLGDNGATCEVAPLGDNIATCEEVPLGDHGATSEEAPMGNNGAPYEEAPLGDNRSTCEEAS